MQKITKQLIADYPDFTFQLSSTFCWSPEINTISYAEIKQPAHLYQLIHEIGHACLNHTSYSGDADLISMELQAWEYAVQQIAPKYNIRLAMDNPVIDESLDSYRQWLHDRSTCPHCHSIGVESTDNAIYLCLSCNKKWRVNQAKYCRLKKSSA